MNSIWGRLAADLSLQPDLGRVGGPRPRQAFAGQYRGCRVTLIFHTAGGGVRGVVARRQDNVLSGEDDLRILPRAGLGGWPGGPKTGDADFDAQVAILTQKHERILLRLDRPTRELLAEMIELGVWITDDQVLIEPVATAAMTTLGDARQLIDSAADLLRALRASTPEQLIEMAFGDPSRKQRERAWSRVQRMSGEGRKWVQPILGAISRHFPPEGPALLSRIEPGEYDFETWLALCDRYAAESGPALLNGLEMARKLGLEGQIVERIADSYTDARRVAPDPERVVSDEGLLRALVEYWRETPDALRVMLDWPRLGEMLQVKILAALGPSDPRAISERLAALDLMSPQAEVARIDTLDALPDDAANPALIGLRPPSASGQRALFGSLTRRSGPAIDAALLAWAQRPLAAGISTSTGVFAEVARRLSAALDVAPSGPLLEQCDATLPAPLAKALTARLVADKPRFGAGWLARYAPNHRTTDPGREAELLGILGELGDPAGEPRCIAALGGSDFLRIAACRALARIGTARALEPLDELTGFFAPGEVKAVAKAAIEAIRERETRGPRGGLTVSGESAGGGLSFDDP